MTIRKRILGSFVALALGAVAIPAMARTNVDMYVNLGHPPPVYYEPVPVARVGWVWVPGYWDWRGHHHHWIPGHWVRSRPAHVHYAPRWYERDGRWHGRGGGWRDSDGDGVPNRYDRWPHNPYRR